MWLHKCSVHQRISYVSVYVCACMCMLYTCVWLHKCMRVVVLSVCVHGGVMFTFHFRWFDVH